MITTHCLLFTTALTLLVGGSSSFADPASMSIGVSGSRYSNEELVGGIAFHQVVASGTISRGHGLGALSPDGGAHASASPGRVSATAASHCWYSGPESQPPSWHSYLANVQASFVDFLTIRDWHGAELPGQMRVRITWRVVSAYHYEDPNSDWTGSGNYLWWSGQIQSGTMFDGFKRRDQGAPIVTEGTPGSSVVTSEMLGGSTAFTLDASVVAQAGNSFDVGLTTSGGYARASSHCSMEVLSIEVLDATSGALLAVNVTATSGHVYPVAQPPAPWMNPATPHLTAHSISRESGSVMLSFASQAGITYRVKASKDMGRTDPWQVLSTLTGQLGVTLATFTDPDAMTQPSRFFIIEQD